MIKVNLLAVARKETAGRKAPTVNLEGAGTLQNVLFAVLIIGTLSFLVWKQLDLKGQIDDLDRKLEDDHVAMKKVEEDRRVADELEKKKQRVEHQIDLITKLKNEQQVPVRLLDEISRNLPDFLWLTAMNENGGALTFSGKATTPTAYANFYNNLDASPYFSDVGRISYRDDGAEGVAFSLAARFVPNPKPAAAPAAPAPAEGAH
ncbi:MAG: PilN domain-containing protein [Acidobacteria bacterium]|nr:PilN domain-containing protein [Acidobacteriota bacterium]